MVSVGRERTALAGFEIHHVTPHRTAVKRLRRGFSFSEGTQIKVGVFNPKGKNLAHQALKENWQFALLTSDAEAKALLESLQVKTLDILEGEQIYVSFDRGYWQVRSSACYELLNLLKTVACEHAESLESVLN